MKVAFLNAWCNGSTGKIIGEIAQQGVSVGINSLLLYGRGETPYHKNAVNINSKFNFYQDAFFSRLLDNHGRNSYFATNRAIKLLNDYKPDLIHLHNLHGYWINFPSLFRYIKNKDLPVVWTLHDCWPVTGHCAYYNYLNCVNRNNNCIDCPGMKYYPKSYIDCASKAFAIKKDCFNSVKRMYIVTPSKWLANIVHNSYLAKYPVKVIHNEIDNTVFHPVEFDYLYKKYNIQKNCKTILYVAMNTNDPWKGFSFVKKLYNLLTDEYQIIIVGNCNQKSKERLINIGRTENQQELAAFYSMADLLINPSLDDNYPTVNLEALACGTPVVAFNTGGIPEQINDRVGYICKDKTTENLKQGIYEVAKAGKNFYKKKCLEQYRQLTNEEENFTLQYINIYKYLLGI